MTVTIVVVTGASGAGKTAAVSALDARALPGIRCYHFDSIGVPSSEEMKRDFGNGENWQAMKTEQWLSLLAADPDRVEIYILDGQTRPSFIRSAAARLGLDHVRILLLDCAPAVRHARLVEGREQPEIVNSQMDCWAAYLRGQADALDLPVIDTTNLRIDEVADVLAAYVDKTKM